MTSRKQFIEAAGATCANWTWSWSFINEAERFVIFTFWDDEERDGRAKILDRSWQRLRGRKQNGYSQAIEHLELVRTSGFQLKVFKQVRGPGDREEEASELKSFIPALINARPVSDGNTIWAEFDPTDVGETIDVKNAKRRNPPWNRDELILALDLYLRFEGNPPGKTSSQVQELSELLNKMSAKLSTEGDDRFRNPSGVYMKMMNFRRLDDRFDGAGLARGGKLEETIWREYADQPEQLSKAANLIRDHVESSGSLLPIDVDEDDDYEADESRVIMRAHKSRERDRTLVRRKKDLVRKKLGKLACEACGFDFEATYGERGGDYIECHHTKPVSELAPGEKTTVADLALVCSNCHRMIHRRAPMLSIDELRKMLN